MHPTGICPRCDDPIDGRHGRVFCRPCAKERITLINRNRMRALRRGLPPPLRTCVSCPTTVGPKRLFCAVCFKARKRLALRIYNQRPEVKARYRERARRPKQKLSSYARQQSPRYKARKRELYRFRYQPKSGEVIACQTLMCKGTFTRNRWNGRRMFCNPCRWANGYVSHGWRRPGRGPDAKPRDRRVDVRRAA